MLPGVDVEGGTSRSSSTISASTRLSNREICLWDRPPLAVSAVCLNHGNHQMRHHRVAIVVCSNDLPITVGEGLSPQEAQWMQMNVEKVTLDTEKSWWHKL